jgi:hypothetical protein
MSLRLKENVIGGNANLQKKKETENVKSSR